MSRPHVDQRAAGGMMAEVSTSQPMASGAGVAQIWAEVLGLVRVEPDDDFFRLGGDSLSAARILARIEDRLGVSVPPQSLFESRTPAGLARAVESMRADGARPAAPAPAPLLADDAATFAELRRIFFHQLVP